jgi:hypothetical protein
VCLLAAPEGIAQLHGVHPDVPIFTAAIDKRLNDHGYIVPALARRRRRSAVRDQVSTGQRRAALFTTSRLRTSHSSPSLICGPSSFAINSSSISGEGTPSPSRLCFQDGRAARQAVAQPVGSG